QPGGVEGDHGRGDDRDPPAGGVPQRAREEPFGERRLLHCRSHGVHRDCGRRRVRDHTTAPAAPTTSRTTPATTTAVTVLSDPDDGASRSSSWLRGSMREIGSRSGRSEEHTSELQSRENLVCRLLLEKKN